MELTICPVNVNNKLREIKAYVYGHFKVTNTKDLKGVVAVEGDLRCKATWLRLADMAHASCNAYIREEKVYAPIEADTIEELFLEAQYRMDYIFSNPLYSY